jgi:Flp pilus assembly pilin Flp
MAKLMKRLWSEEQGQDIAEYAVMLAVILVLAVVYCERSSRRPSRVAKSFLAN